MAHLETDLFVASSGARPLRRRVYRHGGKRLFDLALGALLLPVLLPVIAVLWMLVRLEGGPGFFGHRRVGRGGASFKCWKIRTMVPDAEARLEALLASDPRAAAEWARDQKLEHDPRVTRLGAFLRRTSLDELPQIWNVLRGEMSFVGPRPVTRDELGRYGVARRAYLQMRPGITGIWQVSGRNDVSYATRILYDRRYAQTCGLRLDLMTLWRTGGAVMGTTGR